MVEADAAYEMGDPSDPSHPSSGRCRASTARDQIHGQVEASVRGGRPAAARRHGPDAAGRLVPADRARPASGPASRRTTRRCSGRSRPIIEAADERRAIAIANASEFGLGSGV